MHSPGINGEGELRGQPANPGSPGKMAVKMCVFAVFIPLHLYDVSFYFLVQLHLFSNFKMATVRHLGFGMT